MKKYYISILILSVTKIAFSQVHFNPINPSEDIIYLPKYIKNGNIFGGISGIEYIERTNQFVLASDTTGFYIFENCRKIQDFYNQDNLINNIPNNGHNHRFESIRQDTITNSYFVSVENSIDTKVLKIKDLNHFTSNEEILKVSPLPFRNKGIEAIAITPNRKLWVAPEAGWHVETDFKDNIVHFFRYNLDSLNKEPVKFVYKITKYPHAVFNEDNYGGISEILSIDDEHLIVLERGYSDINGEKKVVASLKNVKVLESEKKLEIGSDAFNFNEIQNLCNIEGMCWGDKEKNTLYIIADDNLSKSASKTLKNQLIVLRKSD